MLLGAAGAGVADAQTPLMDAVKAGHTATVRALLAKRPDVKAAQTDGTTALHWAATGDVPGPCRCSFAPERTCTRATGTVQRRWLASLNGNAATMGMLLEAGASADTTSTDGETVLMVAARTGKVDAVNTLLARGADPNAKGWRGQTALM